MVAPTARLDVTTARAATAPAWWTLTAERALATLDTGPRGLTTEEARARRQRYGPNVLRAVPPVAAWRIAVSQFRSVVVGLLAAAVVLAVVMGDVVDAAAIAAVLLINTTLGFGIELRARRAMEALMRLQEHQARALRDGEVQQLDARDVVPGDVILLEAGDAVPVDARLLDGSELASIEASLTGESQPVAKTLAALPEDTPLAERTNLVFKGTAIATGRARAVVVETGMRTELGRIGLLVESIAEAATPLERRLDALGRRLVVLTLGIAAVVVALGLARRVPLAEMVQAGLALAIAAVPEALPAVATIALAVGLRRMARRRALVRRLPAVETLGSVTVVCVDKTGTLTAGVMTVTTIVAGTAELTVSGAGYGPEGGITGARPGVDASEAPAVTRLLRSAMLASRAEVVADEHGGWKALGDPMDAALLVAARKAGLDTAPAIRRAGELGELPFSSARLFSAVFHREDGTVVTHAKGAVHRLLERCSGWQSGEGVQVLDASARESILTREEELAVRGLRVIGIATGAVAAPADDALRGLTFMGLVGLTDPPAPDVAGAIAALHAAGIRVVMLTGDQSLTARAIGAAIGLVRPGDEVVDARALRRLDDRALVERVGRTSAFARIAPEDKLRIVAALQSQGAIVSMLGDGVNDAPALRKADIGVAMGVRGTDVAKEASDIILQDDRLATVVAAVEEGRVIFDNIRKFIFYLFSCNSAEILVILVASALGVPIPLLPLQLLWLNLATDTFPALALAFEPAEAGVMARPPRNPQAAILSRAFLRAIAFYATLIAAAGIGALVWARDVSGDDPARVRTIVFMTVALAQLFHLGNARSLDAVLLPRRALANGYALAAVFVVVLMQLATVHWPPLARLLGTVPLAPVEWSVVLVLAVLPAVLGQLLRGLRGAKRAGRARA